MIAFQVRNECNNSVQKKTVTKKLLFLCRDRDQIIIGEENCVMLMINSRNEGEGAYEAELHIKIPPEADYTGIERNNKVMLKSYLFGCRLFSPTKPV